MLYYIKHEVIGECVQQIHDGVHHRWVLIYWSLVPLWIAFVLLLVKFRFVHQQQTIKRQYHGGIPDVAIVAFWSERISMGVKITGRFVLTQNCASQRIAVLVKVLKNPRQLKSKFLFVFCALLFSTMSQLFFLQKWGGCKLKTRRRRKWRGKSVRGGQIIFRHFEGK